MCIQMDILTGNSVHRMGEQRIAQSYRGVNSENATMMRQERVEYTLDKNEFSPFSPRILTSAGITRQSGVQHGGVQGSGYSRLYQAPS